jgi:multisubunit Na+/H+ antiporter MnhB subunit
VLFQLVSLAGAFLILAAYLAINRRWLGPHHRLYNFMNLLGGVLLLWVAIVDQRIGFVILEAAWAIIAIPPLFRPPEEAPVR